MPELLGESGKELWLKLLNAKLEDYYENRKGCGWGVVKVSRR